MRWLRRMRAEGGQVAAEYLGIAVVVAAVLAFILVRGVPTPLLEHERATTCRVLDADCATPEPAARPAR